MLHDGVVLCLDVSIFIAIEKAGIGGCTTTIFQMLRSMGHLSFAAGLQVVHPFCFASPFILFVRACFLILIFVLRFRMARSLFLRIVQAVEQYDNYFVQKRDANGCLGLSCLQKITAAYMMISYGVPADFMDQYIRIGESTVIESLRKFVRAVVEVFGDEYLRSPNEYDTVRLLATRERRGFPEMLGSIDCMHWKWTNYPSAWQGQYTGHVHEPTIILKVVASQDLWI